MEWTAEELALWKPDDEAKCDEWKAARVTMWNEGKPEKAPLKEKSAWMRLNATATAAPLLLHAFCGGGDGVRSE